MHGTELPPPFMGKGRNGYEAYVQSRLQYCRITTTRTHLILSAQAWAPIQSTAVLGSAGACPPSKHIGPGHITSIHTLPAKMVCGTLISSIYADRDLQMLWNGWSLGGSIHLWPIDAYSDVIADSFTLRYPSDRFI